jgi:hypothetical protein
MSLNAVRPVKAEARNSVIPGWRAGIQMDTDVSGRVPANLDTGYPCRHNVALLFHVSVGELKLMIHFVVSKSLVKGSICANRPWKKFA